MVKKDKSVDADKERLNGGLEGNRVAVKDGGKGKIMLFDGCLGNKRVKVYVKRLCGLNIADGLRAARSFIDRAVRRSTRTFMIQ